MYQLLVFLLCFQPFTFAVPQTLTSSSPPDKPDTPVPTPFSAHRHTSTTQHVFNFSTTRSHPLHAFTHPVGLTKFPATDTVPHPIHTRQPEPGPFFPPPSSPSQKPILIVFEVLGGIFAFLLLLCLLRCGYRYRAAPKRDRIAEVIDRHYLQRELEELERNPLALRRNASPDPAPPYFPPPPDYSAPHIASPPALVARNSNHPEVTLPSPPASPPLLRPALDPPMIDSPIPFPPSQYHADTTSQSLSGILLPNPSR